MQESIFGKRGYFSVRDQRVQSIKLNKRQYVTRVVIRNYEIGYTKLMNIRISWQTLHPVPSHIFGSMIVILVPT